jgi:hypothetical protein
MKYIMAFIALIVLAVDRLLPTFPSFPRIADMFPRGDVYGVNATKSRTNPVQKIDVRDNGARIRYLNESYTPVAEGTIGDVIHLPALPAGAKIIAHLSQVGFEAGNAGALLALGKTGAATALKAATSIADAGVFALDSPADGVDDVTLAVDEELIATNSVAAIKAGQTIRFRIAYVEGS